ncbi:MAG: serine/threonine protein kinase [Myxococcota bacterium]
MHSNSPDSKAQFFALTPDRVLDAVEAGGERVTGLCYPLNSFENRVYELERVDGVRVIAKFYRPGRWSEATILEEHHFLQELAAAEIPVCAPLKFPDGSTLKRAQKGTTRSGDRRAQRGPVVLTPLTPENDLGIWYALFPKVGGRAPEELRDEQLHRLGMLLARIHNVGASRTTSARLALTPDTYGIQALQTLRESGRVPMDLQRGLHTIGEAVVEAMRPLFMGLETLRVHGDCHTGNLLWGSQGAFFLDFDDMVTAPAVQDVWLLTPSRDAEGLRQRDVLLEGYETFRPFDRRSLHLVEGLRALRYLHYAAWIARRWDDPAFPVAFPHFGTHRYWQELTQDLHEQLQHIQRAAGSWTGGGDAMKRREVIEVTVTRRPEGPGRRDGGPRPSEGGGSEERRELPRRDNPKAEANKLFRREDLGEPQRSFRRDDGPRPREDFRRDDGPRGREDFRRDDGPRGRDDFRRDDSPRTRGPQEERGNRFEARDNFGGNRAPQRGRSWDDDESQERGPARPSNRPENRPENRPDNRPDNRPENRQENRYESRQEDDESPRGNNRPPARRDGDSPSTPRGPVRVPIRVREDDEEEAYQARRSRRRTDEEEDEAVASTFNRANTQSTTRTFEDDERQPEVLLKAPAHYKDALLRFDEAGAEVAPGVASVQAPVVESAPTYPRVHFDVRVLGVTDDEYQRVLMIREEVFVEELERDLDDELDGRDRQCQHLLALAGDGRAGGCARLRPEDRVLVLDRLAVMYKLRKKGMGRALLMRAEELANEKGLHLVVLARPENRSFFARAGYHVEEGSEATGPLKVTRLRRG